MAGKKLTFEQSMSRLEEIVGKLEQGECGLDESLKLFEEGAKLAASCNQMLDQAEPIPGRKLPLNRSRERHGV